MRYFLIFFLSWTIISCSQQEPQGNTRSEKPITVELTTTKGMILLELSNRTPLHRDNFVRIVKEGKLDSMIFHRVLADFVAQAGEYDSLTLSRMDSLEVIASAYTIPAEIDSALFHQRGALGAARSDNPDRASASQSFYIVQRGPRSDSLMEVDQARINGWLQKHYFLQDEAHANWKEALLEAEEERDEALFAQLQDTVAAMAAAFAFEPYVIPEPHRNIYRTVGGTPHLDQNYTVFGQVTQGMAVVDSIAAVPVDPVGRPLKEVYILRAKILEST